jgi:hypothetical protein
MKTTVLLALGYSHELSRGLNCLSSFSFNYTSVAALASMSILYSYGLATGGPAVMVWGWLITSVMTVMAGAALGEICSTYPSAGSVYHWAAKLGEGKAPFWAFVAAWFNLLGEERVKDRLRYVGITPKAPCAMQPALAGNLASIVSTAYGFAEVCRPLPCRTGRGES